MEFVEETAGVDTHYSGGVELKNILLILSGSFIRFIGHTYFQKPPETFGKFTRATREVHQHLCTTCFTPSGNITSVVICVRDKVTIAIFKFDLL